MSAAYAVVVPGRYGASAPARQVYVRRRAVALALLAVVVMLMWAGATHVLASRGGVPASTPVARPAAALAAGPAAVVTGQHYLVQPGDTLWSIAATHRHGGDLARYVDRLVAANGGTSLVVGQLLTLP